jgi:hypothetical protein
MIGVGAGQSSEDGQAHILEECAKCRIMSR